MNLLPRKRLVSICLVLIVLLLPAAANAGVGDIVRLLSTITATLKAGMGQVLSDIQTINATAANLKQQIVWPVALLNQTKASVSQLHAQFSILADQIHSIPTNSAKLLNASRFEMLLRSAQPSKLGQVNDFYSQIYLQLPRADQVLPAQRNVIDSSDALALGALKTAMTSDAASKQMLNVADGIERAAAATAPGSAGILAAEAMVANLQNQALLQKMLAADLRQQGAKLAEVNALRKQSTEAAKNLRSNLQQILNRR